MTTSICNSRLFRSAAILGCLMTALGLVRADVPEVIARVKPSVLIVGTFKATNSH
jgi:hypothetical protein